MTDEAQNNTTDAASMARIDQFLEGAGAEPTGEQAAPAEQVEGEDWREGLPEGHASGFVALIGRANVGKSTLVNALVKQKVAIVSDKPQTTRHRLMGILTEPAYQMIFIDTPGIHPQPHTKLNELMVEQAIAAIPDADVILFVVDVSVWPRKQDKMIARILKTKAQQRPVIFVLNKMDKLPLDKAEGRIESYWQLFPEYADSMPTSALRGTNVERLKSHLLEHLPEGPRYYPGDQITDQTERQIAAELIREGVLKHTYQEVPHATGVLVEDYKERDNGVTYISARIWVERESQRPIMIGRGGQKLKQIGAAARQELERFIGGKVYLDLWVKVQPKWRDRDARLQELGY